MSKDAKLIGAKLLSLAGDSSFDFALPLAIVAFSPDSTLLAGVFIAARKLLYIFLLPKLSRLLDRTPAMTAMTAILASQVIAISLITLVFSQLVGHTVTSLATGPWHIIAMFIAAAAFDALRQVSEALSEIAIKNQWLPRLYGEDERTAINAKLKSLSLAIQIMFPLVTALLFFSATVKGEFPQGFYYVAAFSVLSFVPEYLWLRSLAKSHPALIEHDNNLPAYAPAPSERRPLWASLEEFAKEPIFLAELTRCFLGVTVLSSQSIFLRTYLLGSVGLSDKELSVFLGLAAVMGLLGVRLLVQLRRHYAIERATGICLAVQLGMILAAGLAFALIGTIGRTAAIAFAFFVAAARIGLHGFTVGLVEIEQATIAPDRSGRVMGMASAVIQVGNLVIMAVATIFSLYSEFYIPVAVSCTAALAAAVSYGLWLKRVAG